MHRLVIHTDRCDSCAANVALAAADPPSSSGKHADAELQLADRPPGYIAGIDAELLPLLSLVVACHVDARGAVVNSVDAARLQRRGRHHKPDNYHARAWPTAVLVQGQCMHPSIHARHTVDIAHRTRDRMNGIACPPQVAV